VLDSVVEGGGHRKLESAGYNLGESAGHCRGNGTGRCGREIMLDRILGECAGQYREEIPDGRCGGRSAGSNIGESPGRGY
jgi:hypothetical protein